MIQRKTIKELDNNILNVISPSVDKFYENRTHLGVDDILQVYCKFSTMVA